MRLIVQGRECAQFWAGAGPHEHRKPAASFGEIPSFWGRWEKTFLFFLGAREKTPSSLTSFPGAMSPRSLPLLPCLWAQTHLCHLSFATAISHLSPGTASPGSPAPRHNLIFSPALWSGNSDQPQPWERATEINTCIPGTSRFWEQGEVVVLSHRDESVSREL